jgi:hypothetical protein
MWITVRKPSDRVGAIARCCVLALLLFGADNECMGDERRPYLGMRVTQLQSSANEGLSREPTESSAGALRENPPVSADASQELLTVDIRPVDREVQIQMNPQSLPPEYPAPVLAGASAIYLGFQPASDCKWPVWPGAQFCHHPLYFEERCIERHGYTSCCCQPAASAAHFFGTALLLPIKMCGQCPGRGVCTPPAF